MPGLRVFFVTAVGGVACFVGSTSLTACSRQAEPSPGPGSASASHGTPPPPRPSAPSNALPIPSASVVAVVNPEGLPVYNGATGFVEGTVLVRGPEAPEVPGLNVRNCPAALDTYGKLFRSGRARPDGLRPLADAVVVVTGYTGAYLPVGDPVKKVNIGPNCGYHTRSITLTFGQRLDVANDSKVPFGPYLDGVFQPAVMLAPPQQNGEPVKIYPPRPGHYALLDQMQPYAREDVYVLRQPLHAVSDLDGHFRVEGVPVGKLKVGAQLPAIGAEANGDVEVRPNVVESVELVIAYTPRPVIAADARVEHVIP